LKASFWYNAPNGLFGGAFSVVATGDGNVSVLIVGEARGAVSASVFRLPGLVVCREESEALDLAASRPFSVIAVVMSSFGPAAGRVIRDIRGAAASSDSPQGGSPRLVILARMHEEPEAIALVKACRNGTGSSVADYIICPAEPAELLACVSTEAPSAALPASISPEEVDRLVRMATEDHLTGAKNRRYLDEFLIQSIERARQNSSEVTLAVLDVDGLKHYNDTWGHIVGDSVLRQAAAAIRRCCRPHDIVARIGGDEFAVVFWDIPKSDHTGQGPQRGEDERRTASAVHPGEMEIIERFRTHIAGAGLPLLGPSGIGTLTMSGGLAAFPHDGSSADELLLAADAALLRAKRSGKNRIYLVGQGD
jgi:PleD family two-component response regulator